MKKLLLVTLMCFYSSVVFCDFPKIHPDLQKKMNETTDNSVIPVYIIFNENLTLNDFSEISYDTPKKERRRIVIERLQNYSQNYQSNVRTFLNNKQSQQVIENYDVLWIANAIILKAPVELIYELASNFNNIKTICYDPEHPVEQLWDSEQSSAPFIEAMSNSNLSAAPEPGVLLM